MTMTDNRRRTWLIIIAAAMMISLFPIILTLVFTIGGGI